MKRSILAIALLGAGGAYAAGPFGVFDKPPGVVAEYDYNVIAGDSRYKHNTYAYVGLRQATKYGIFQLGAQRFTATVDGFSDDKATGWQLGYSYPIRTHGLIVTPKLAYGHAYDVEPAGSRAGPFTAKYYQAVLEVGKPITKQLIAFGSVTRVGILNTDRINDSHRVGAGVDYLFTPQLAGRLAYSRQRSKDVTSNGVITAVVYNF